MYNVVYIISCHLYSSFCFQALRGFCNMRYLLLLLLLCNISERAERASLNFFAFSHSNTAISLNILLVLQILCFRKIFNFRCQHSPYILQSMQFPFITHGMVLYKRQYTDKTLTLRKCMCMRASEASELRKFWYIYILKLLFLSIFCRYINTL